MRTALQSSRTTSEAVRALADKPSVQRSFPLVQQLDLNFLNRTNCSSCHRYSLSDVTMGGDKDLANKHSQKLASYLDQKGWREGCAPGVGCPRRCLYRAAF